MDVAARNRLVIQYAGLANKLAGQLWNRSALVRRLGGIDDVVQIAQLALIRSAELYRADNPTKASFCTYAHRSIRRRIINDAQDAGLIRLPRYLVQRLHGSDPAHDTWNMKLGRRAWALGVLVPHSEGLHNDAEEEPDLEPLRAVLARLSHAEHELLCDLWGLDGQLRKTQAELAAERGCTKQNIGHLWSRLRRKLRRLLEQELDRDHDMRRRQVA
jgi:RNA polymerase sigma factor (sigma-70 family)